MMIYQISNLLSYIGLKSYTPTLFEKQKQLYLTCITIKSSLFTVLNILKLNVILY